MFRLLFRQSFAFLVVMMSATSVFIDAEVHPSQAALPVLNCSSRFQIDQNLGVATLGSAQQFANGHAWSMCFTPVKGYGFVLSDIRYRNGLNSAQIRVIESMHIAQMFVPYDNNAARYHDISYGVQLAKLTNGPSGDCPSPGVISSDGTLCITVEPRTGLGSNSTIEGERIRIFGYYGIGAYYYTFQYIFNDDGSIEPMLGASGSLQWFSTDQTTGWPIAAQTSGQNWIGVNHNHLAMWRIHFSIDDGSLPQMVIRKVSLPTGTTSTLLTETAMSNSLASNQYWTVTAQFGNANPPFGFEIEPSVESQYRAATENFTWYDFYLTQYHSNEILVDGGLLTGSKNVKPYLNGEQVSDPVVWYGINFHHVPHEEDNTRMPEHWQGFVLRPLQ